VGEVGQGRGQWQVAVSRRSGSRRVRCVRSRSTRVKAMARGNPGTAHWCQQAGQNRRERKQRARCAVGSSGMCRQTAHAARGWCRMKEGPSVQCAVGRRWSSRDTFSPCAKSTGTTVP